MNTERLKEIIGETTQEFRKGNEVTERVVDNVHVTEVFAMPRASDAPANLEMVDVHFMEVGVDTTKAHEHRAELVKILQQNRPFWQKGPSYIEVGDSLGDQGRALRLFALGEALDLWEVVTPARLGLDGETANQLAGQGYVMVDGFRA